MAINKEFLKEHGVADDQIDAIIAEHGKTVQAEQKKTETEKTRADGLQGELDTANGTINELKKDGGDNEDLQVKIKTYEETIKGLQKENQGILRTAAVKEGLTALGCQDPDYAIYKNGGIEKFSFSDDGKVVGLKDVAETIKKNSPSIFANDGNVDKGKPGYVPKGGDNQPVNNPFSKEHFNLTEQGRILKENPDRAKALAKAAGVSI